MIEHKSVLLQECIDALAIKSDGIYIDGTFGRGGHSRAILEKLSAKGQLIAIDKDPVAIDHADQLLSDDERFSIVQSSYAEIKEIAKQKSLLGKVDGILLDCGVSSPQLDQAERGFSFMQDGPLDMRMDTSQALDAKTWVNETSSEEMARVFKLYGEERFAKRIANAIVTERQEKLFETTLQLAEVVKAAHPRWEKHKHPATRVFQAIRIEINKELADLEKFLADCLEVLAVGGRLVIISFHSLEDRLVKQFMRNTEQGPQIPKEIPIMPQQVEKQFKRIGKAIKPNEEEINHNVRARSAVLRIGEKLV